jgi:hypothetical protein
MKTFKILMTSGAFLFVLGMGVFGTSASADVTVVGCPTQCVPHCDARGIDGSCISYGTDFCAPLANCVQQCLARDITGVCLSWGADFCGTNVTCAQNCGDRDVTGACLSWEADSCSPGWCGIQ